MIFSTDPLVKCLQEFTIQHLEETKQSIILQLEKCDETSKKKATNPVYKSEEKEEEEEGALDDIVSICERVLACIIILY